MESEPSKVRNPRNQSEPKKQRKPDIMSEL